MRNAISTLLCFFLALTSWSKDTDVITIQFHKSDVYGVLAYYERLSGTSVFVALDLQTLVTVQTAAPIPRKEALELIRKTLLERYGIELRAISPKETLAAWSKDPKFPRRSDEPMTEEDRDALPKAKIRIIKSEDRK